MPFLLNNVPKIFQRSMNVIFSCAKWQLAFAYFSYNVISSRKLKKDIYCVQKVLLLPNDADKIFKLTKCSTFTVTIKDLSYVTRPLEKHNLHPTQLSQPANKKYQPASP